MESDKDLTDRYHRVEAEIATLTRQLERLKFGGNRDRKARLIGSLRFTLLGIESEMRDRGLWRL